DNLPAAPSLVDAVLSPAGGELQLDDVLSVSVTFRSEAPISRMFISWATPSGGNHGGFIESWTAEGDNYTGSAEWTLSEPFRWPSGQYPLDALSVQDATGRT